MNVIESVREFIEENRLLDPGQRVVVGVSGGADSLCLLDVLYHLNYDLRVVHVDHQLRAESGAEAEFTRRTAAGYGLEARIVKADVAEWSARGRSLEEAARLARYAILAQAAHDLGTEVLATGHTADDQAETVLMHFLRGAGPEGLRGMLPVTDMSAWADVPTAAGLRLVRPLLRLRRADTVAHCAGLGLSPVQDASNRDLAYQRNRLRHELLPILEAYNPRLREALLRTGQVMAAQSDLLAGLVAEAWPHVVTAIAPESLRIRVPEFSHLPLAVQRGLIRCAAAALRSRSRDVDWEATERARLFLLEPPQTRQADWIAGLHLRHWGTEASISASPVLAFPEFPQLLTADEVELPVPGQLGLARGWAVQAEEVPSAPSLLSELPVEGQARQALFDADTLRWPLSVRPPKAGDRMRPLGLAGSTKIADLLINQHIPQPARRRWPIIASGDELLWVVGIRRAEHGRLTAETRRTVVLRLVQP